MSFRTELFLAWKYFKPKRNAVSIITLISVIGVALGVAVLIVVLSVMTGFSDKMREKLLDTTSHAQIRSQFRGVVLENPEPVLELVRKCGGNAMSVILSRAIPEIDGLKPSHRKLLYTMYKKGLINGKLTKSANIVGETMKLNPH
jgi:ABC-type lipoprotein release transport system permease subunit